MGECNYYITCINLITSNVNLTNTNMLFQISLFILIIIITSNYENWKKERMVQNVLSD